MNKKLTILPALLMLASCGGNGGGGKNINILFEKDYAFAGIYTIDEENEMNWLKTNFDKIDFNNTNEDAKGTGFYYYRRTEIERESLDTPATFDELAVNMKEKALKVAKSRDVFMDTTTISIGKYKNGFAPCHFDDHSGKEPLTAEMNLKKDGENLKGSGKLYIEYREIEGSMNFSVVEWKDDKNIACTHFDILDTLVNNSCQFIFYLKDTEEKHTIDCYFNFLPVEK